MGRVRTASLRLAPALAAAAVLAATAAAAPRSVTRAQANAVAARINLVHADVPHLTQLPAPSPTQVAAQRTGSAKLAACYHGMPYARVYADVASPGFQTSGPSFGETVSSDAEIFPTSALAVRDLRAADTGRGRSCVLAAYRAQVAGGLTGAQRLSDTIARLPVSLRGAVHPFGVRMTFTVRSRASRSAKPVRLIVDAIGFAHRQAEVALVIAANPGLPPAAQERSLLRVLLARARAVLGP